MSSLHPRGVLRFTIVYLACALLFQLGGATPSWGPSDPLEAFGAGLLCMLAVVALVLARRAEGLRRAFWLASVLALATLGLDEFLELHESAGGGLAGDALKAGLWLGAGGALLAIRALERPERGERTVLFVGYGLHTLYLAIELGDGGLYRLPLAAAPHALVEGLAKVAMLSAYLVAFAALAARTKQGAEVGRLGDGAGAAAEASRAA